MTLSSQLNAGAIFQINIGSFTNPESTLTTSTFEFRTYNSSGAIVDQKLTGITMTATAGTFTTASMTPADLTVAASTTVTFNLTLSHKVVKGGTIRVVMPKWNPNAPTSSDILPMIQGPFVCGAIENLNATVQ